MKKTLLFLSLICTSVLFAQSCYLPVTNYATGDGPRCIETADVNEDGKFDLITENQFNNGYTMSILLGDGSGNFAAGMSFPLNSVILSIVIADFNKDGHIDIASCKPGGSSGIVTIRLGDGTGAFFASTDYVVTTGSTDLTVADFNGDNKLDIATANSSSNNLSVIFGDGLGGFSGLVNFNAADYPQRITSADYNNDGEMDLAASNYTSGNVSVLLGNGTGGFATVVNYAVASYCTPIISKDMNADGKMDIVTFGAGINCFTVLLGDGSGSFQTGINFYQTGNYNDIVSSDFNYDGKMDLAAVSSVTDEIRILSGDGLGSFSDVASITVGDQPESLIASDFNGDKKIDLACSNRNTNNVSVILGSMTISTTKTDVTCFGGKNGSISAEVKCGLAPISYLWNTIPAQTTATVTGLAQGTYVLTVTDALGAKKIATVTVSEPAPLSAYVGVKPNTKCVGACNGELEVQYVSGGPTPFSYQWSATAGNQTTAIVKTLCKGNYSVVIKDGNQCSIVKNVQVHDSTTALTMVADVSVYDNVICSGTTCYGAASINSVSGGNDPYTYKWSASANNQTTQSVSNLCANEYSVVITDSNLCAITKNVSIKNASVSDPNIYLTNLAAIDQTNVSPAFVAYYSYSLPAQIVAPASNPRNFVDPGNKARFKIECKNQKVNGQSVVSGICKVRTNSPFIKVTDSISALNNIGWGNQAWSADEFEIEIKPTTPSGSNAYIDFFVQENGVDYLTSCVSIPIRPLIYSPTTAPTIDDDNNPDSQGNNDNICDPNEIIEFYPWLDNISKLNVEYVRGKLENLDLLNYINIWNGIQGVGTTVYNATWWNYSFAKPQVIDAQAVNTKPEYDFVFNYGQPVANSTFNLHLVLAGGFKLFSGDALSLVQWSLPYTFNGKGTSGTGTNALNENEVNLIEIYPNPTSGIVQLDYMNLEENVEVSVYNLLGEQLTESSNKPATIDLSSFGVGTYFISVKAIDKAAIYKVVKY